MWLFSQPAWAVLGQPASSVHADQKRLKAKFQATAQNQDGYSVQEIKSTDGTLVREYISSTTNTVFGIAWQGAKTPDLSSLLGTYFPAYKEAAQNHTNRRGPWAIQKDALIVEITGHMRAFYGRAYVTDLLPEGISQAVVK